MKVVLDTNVVVSAFLSPHGPPAQILYQLLQGDLRLLYDARIYEEYGAVLNRDEFDLPKEIIQQFLSNVQSEGQLVIARPLMHRLPDPDDEAFLEVAVEGGADALITGNLKHFPKSAANPLLIISPRDFLNRLRR